MGDSNITAIDRELGLDRYEGDEKVYGNVLETFKRSNKDTLRNLNSAAGEGDIKLARRIAHSLRGAAGTIGATRLADAAFRLESILSPKNAERGSAGGEAFETQMALLGSEYNAVFDELELFVEEEQEDDFGSCAMCREKTLELIDRLTPFLEAGDAASLEYFDEIKENFRLASEGFRLFITQMEQYDFEQALETANSIRQFMGV